MTLRPRASRRPPRRAPCRSRNWPRATGVDVETIRYYEKEGLLPRRAAGQRLPQLCAAAVGATVLHSALPCAGHATGRCKAPAGFRGRPAGPLP
ncbi:MerR family DNA-binding transcriptional regulator [Hydrogenophaga sp.]|uniref:MerR family DNA-binding transcriptional regulator n=1 Tax=Hydrogenophaga sp. TaxID=1904254 RepID=UPI003D271D74